MLRSGPSILLSLVAFVNLTIAAPTSEYTLLASGPDVVNLNVSIRADNYTVQENDTIFSVAEKYGVGACDLARVNILADPNYIYPGEVLLLPTRATFPDDTSCFQQNNTAATNTCIYGGPHVYTIFPGDTIQKIANYWFNVTVESFINQTAQTGYIAALNPGPYDVLEAGETIKVPICENTACTMSDFTLSYGTLQDFGSLNSVPPGQLLSLNLGYNHSDAGGPTLVVVYDCATFD